MAGRESREAFVTLATNDTYSLGCLVLGNSLRHTAHTSRQLVVMVTQGVSQPMRNQLARVFDMIYDVNLLDSRDSGNLALLGRPDLSCTFTKLHCWRLTMFDKAIFLDADTLILQNVDELFDREELSAAPDAGWPDCFNSGVFVFRPSEETYQSLLQYALSQGSFDGGDQGLLNMYFRDWATKDISKHLPFIYNVVSQAFYSYLPAFTKFKQNVKIVHFIGATKPWHHPYNTSTGEVTPLPETGHSKEFLQLWWSIFMRFVQPSLDPALGGLIGELASMTIHSPGAPADQSTLSDQERKLNWERGQMDYLGADKFENIQRKLDTSINEGSPSSSSDYTSSPFSRPDVQKEEPRSPPVEVKKEPEPVPKDAVKSEVAKKPVETPSAVPSKQETKASGVKAGVKPEPSLPSAAPAKTATAPKPAEAKPATKVESAIPAPTKTTATAAATSAAPTATKPGLALTKAGAPSAAAGTKPGASPTLAAPADTSKGGGTKSPTSPGKLASRLPWMKK